jgi:FdhE protein
MGNSDDRINILKEDMDRLLAEKPHLKTLIDAFRPVIITQYVLQDKIAGKRITLSPDKLKVMGGIPLIKEHALFLPNDPYQDVALDLAAAIRDGFPHLAEDMDRLATFFQQSPGKLDDYFLRSGLSAESEMPAWATEIQVQPAVLALLINTVRRMILTGRAKDMAEEIAALPWDKGYCPLCGSFPILAFLRENGQRWLHCACCHHEWTYPRPQCPCCEHETPEDTTYLYLEGDKENSAFLCEKCQKYLITVNRTGSLREMDPDLTAISLAHLDVILQEKGFSPMAEREWNQF